MTSLYSTLSATVLVWMCGVPFVISNVSFSVEVELSVLQDILGSFVFRRACRLHYRWRHQIANRTSGPPLLR